ncbi:T-cell surface glycoprotein CD5 [Bos indicus x Bos taurus]|uniref:T-cell surface glycoprotein CD5 n=3 Tax=Bos TaxID=9903 RepID=CD5_BOVIN|nr:T-cell surface glycoprotein CD5 [Bos indicus x Bos taurus]P19238.2 RecName: Full=T-cell surface glycoprotein CD5; AltName: CD_antigen=CD5; Flags: Precursor [Bos taurus]AAI13238.1 CD5 protein [Bos taurus]DAA13823.1 TPA: T-cell surface glycoprotein CD5 precursor [Bos taurus]
MGSQHLPLAALYLLELLVTSCLGGLKVEVQGLTMRLSGSGSRCQGRLEVSNGTEWYAVHSQSWGQLSLYQVAPRQFLKLCQELQCRDPLLLSSSRYFKEVQFQKLIICHGQLGSFSNCSLNRGRQVDSLALICLEPPRTTAPPTTSPPTTTPEPTAPPRFQLVAEPGGLRCAGVVEFYSGGLGGTIGIEPQNDIKDLGQLICAALQCGSFLKPLPETEEAQTQKPEGQRPLPIRWEIQNPKCTSLEQCFRKVQPWVGGQALGLICSDFQPKVQSRLVGGSDVCEGSVEVRSGKGQKWDTLCDDSWAKGTARWEEVCREQQCGNVSSYRGLDPSEKTLGGFYCPPGILSRCHKLEEKKSHCKRVFVTCQNSSRAGLGAGAVMSIILALLLLAVLLVVCGPLAYKKVVKKFRQKKQRQWIGPTGMNQNMSFHRNHTVTVRSQVENATASHVENEYSQPPRNSQISAYPALEGALHRISTQPDNSSDSDYELHGAQRL